MLSDDERKRIEAAHRRLDTPTRRRRREPSGEPWWTLYTVSWRHSVFVSVLLAGLLALLWLLG